MKYLKCGRIGKVFDGIIAAMILIGALCGYTTPVWAAEDGAYLVSRTTSYVNPDTGVPDDGGSNIALGEAMCSSIIDSDVLVEYAGGKMYVTIGVGLMSNISDMSVQVQSGGSYSTAALTMTGSCTRDGDVCNHYRFEMPSKDSYIRMKMYVVPMGRAVTFYVKLDMSTARSGTGNFVSEMVSVPQSADTSNTDTQESVVITAIENTENVEREENEDENEEMTDAEEATEYESTEETTAFSENMSSEVISADTSNQYLSGVTGLSLHFVNETSQNDDTDSNYTALAVFAVIIVAVGAFYIVKRQRGRKDV